MLQEFKQFIMRGNVMDLAVGVIIGGAFQKIITALVEKLIMPLIGIIVGGINFEKEVIKVGDAELGWGAVFQEIMNFVIVGFVIFAVIKALNTASKNKLSLVPEQTQEDILKDIRTTLESINAKS